ncbi:MAG: translation initiation factor IF-2 [Desulfobulbaceae bacterium]
MHRKPGHQHHENRSGPAGPTSRAGRIEEKLPTLSLVVKGDTDGCEEAVCTSMMTNAVPGVALEILHKGVGDINKNDVLTAAEGSHLVIGFNVGVHPRVPELCKELAVEIRIYSVIYQLQKDIVAIAESLLPREVEEKILGSARVIALFKGGRKGIILGCQVEEGRLQTGDRFRVIAAMGPIYSGVIESLHIERDTVSKASAGQQVGLKIKDFKAVKIGDSVESFLLIPPPRHSKWVPSGKILQL